MSLHQVGLVLARSCQIALPPPRWQPAAKRSGAYGNQQTVRHGERRAGRRAARRHDHHVRRLRPVRHPLRADRGHPRHRREGPDRHLQQCRDRRRRTGIAAGDAADPEDDQLLRRGERDLRPAIPGRRVGDRVQPAGHAGRAHPRRRGGHPGLLHRDRRRHGDRRAGKDVRTFQRPRLHHGNRAVRRPGDHPCLEGRPGGQPRLPDDGPQLQSGDGDRRQGDGGAGGGDGGAGRAGRRPHHHARHLRAAHGAVPGVEKRIEQRTVRKRAA